MLPGSRLEGRAPELGPEDQVRLEPVVRELPVEAEMEDFRFVCPRRWNPNLDHEVFVVWTSIHPRSRPLLDRILRELGRRFLRLGRETTDLDP